jgi:hypothetical protein
MGRFSNNASNSQTKQLESTIPGTFCWVCSKVDTTATLVCSVEYENKIDKRMNSLKLFFYHVMDSFLKNIIFDCEFFKGNEKEKRSKIGITSNL